MLNLKRVISYINYKKTELVIDTFYVKYCSELNAVLENWPKIALPFWSKKIYISVFYEWPKILKRQKSIKFTLQGVSKLVCLWV